MKKYIAHEIKGGIFCRTIPVTVSRRLGGMPYAQAGWIDTVQKDGTTASDFYSYSSKIFTACVSALGVDEISVRNADADMNYSRTTSRQVSAAMREMGLTDTTIAMLKKWFTSDPKHVTAVHIGRGDWVDGCTGEVIA